MSKRLRMAKLLHNTGILHAARMLPSKPGIVVFNYHRIGNAHVTRFDRGVFGPTAEGFDQQVRSIKKQMPIVSGEELENLVLGGRPLKRMYAAITFDDGYLDNYTEAFPVLKANDCTAAFFLVVDYAGKALVPWWDEIAHLIRMTDAKEIVLTYPAELHVVLGEDREPAIHKVLTHYKRPDNIDPERMMGELRAQCHVGVPEVQQRFLSWEQAREMAAAGMVIGSHTVSHMVLSQLSAERQREELVVSKRRIEAEIGRAVTQLAYPVGTRLAFRKQTEEIAYEAGYKLCFSFYGGVNQPQTLQPTNILRGQTPNEYPLFLTEMTVKAKLGRAIYR
ncbi:MAG: polysaccharide deacetylase family protein [Acidobacteria bacterium]|nr:polysaccharide deacetylase family protein [Acidobacteriota bacterium]